MFLPDSEGTPGALLALLLAPSSSAQTLEALLTEACLLHRLDGETLRGRPAIVEALTDPTREAHLAVVAAGSAKIRVELRVKGVSGGLRFTMRARLEGGRLAELWME